MTRGAISEPLDGGLRRLGKFAAWRTALMFSRRMFNLMAVASGAIVTHPAAAELEWSPLPPLPPAAGQVKQPGVASPFVGVQGNALIVAGGANFPDKMPWEGGAKKWQDDIWILEKQRDGT